MDFIDGVRTFNLAAGRTEDHWDTRAVALHIGLMAEEFSEVLGAAGLYVEAGELEELGRAFKRGAFDLMVAKADRKELLDGCVDTMVTSVGCMMSQGVDVQGACGEVNRSNLAKLVDGKAIKDGNGKIQKPDGWTPPNLEPFVNRR